MILPLAAITGGLPAQDVPQTLGAVVVIAERAATPMNRSTAAVTRLTAADLARLPYATLADVLRRVPGFAVVEFDGLGRDPQLMVRGFYGGGEADYVLVMVDGRAVNLAHNGTIAWETLPALDAIESIEIVRGSASALHGDAAVAGVINIVTHRPMQRPASWHLAAESFAGLSASVDATGFLTDRNVSGSASFDRTNGFRDHAARTSAGARGKIRYSPSLSASAQVSYRDFEEPGPLMESLLGDGSESDPRFHRDGGHDGEWGASIDYDGWLGAGATTRTTVRGGGRRASLTRTLPLAPAFGDTRERELTTLTLGVATQADANATILPAGEHLTIGASADFESVDSRYFSGTGGSRTLDASGDGARGMLGAFAHLAGSPQPWLRWTLGVRTDWLFDSFHTGNGALDLSASHFAFSPKAGLNIRYAATERVSGHFWLSASRTFKAPTLDQLFDQRPIAIPFPPFTLTTSNADLDPQRGTSLEAGVYHDASLGPTRVGLTLTLYEIAMKDELDFDLQTFKYVNIARSRHRGIEAGLTATRGIASGFASLTLQDAVSRTGGTAGNQLKAIPGQIYATGITVTPPRLGSLSLSVTRAADVFIDDSNTHRIDPWTRVDAQLSRRVGDVEIMAGVRNLLDERINGTGFLDPSGSGEAYFYPAAGRAITLGFRHGR